MSVLGLIVTIFALPVVYSHFFHSPTETKIDEIHQMLKKKDEKQELPPVYSNLTEVKLITENNPSYPIGELVGGIPWKKGNVLARVSISNETAIKAYDVDLTLTFDSPFIRVAQITQVPNIIIQPKQQEKIGGFGGWVEDASGKIHKFSATPEELQTLNTYPTNVFVFKQTETMSELPVRLVFVSGSGYKSGNFTTALFSVRPPKSLTVTGHYKAKYDEQEYTIKVNKTVQAVEQRNLGDMGLPPKKL